MKFRELLDRSCKMWIWVPGGRAYRVSDEVLDQTVEELTLKEWVSYGIEHGYAQRTGHLAYDRVTPVTTLVVLDPGVKALWAKVNYSVYRLVPGDT